MNKRKILILTAALCILATLAIGGTLAYFTDTKTSTNTFTMGNVQIKLDETNVNDPEGPRVTGNEYAVAPGSVVKKDPVVHNVGANAAYIRATVNVENWMNLCAAFFPDYELHYPNEGYEQSLKLLVGELGEGWSIIGVEAGTPFTVGNFSARFILKYDGTLASGADTTPMFEKVMVPKQIKNENSSSFGDITVKAQAIQTDNFDSWEAAFAAFDGQPNP